MSFKEIQRQKKIAAILENFKCDSTRIDELFSLGLGMGQVKKILDSKCNSNNHSVGSSLGNKLYYQVAESVKGISDSFGVSRIMSHSLGKFSSTTEQKNMDLQNGSE